VTDKEILERIYADYKESFQSFTREDPSRSSKIYVPIDVAALAKSLNTDAHELFGRLNYHLDQKYRYQQIGDAWVHLFAFKVGEDRDAINYPYLAAILAGMRQERTRESLSLVLSILSLIVSIIALIGSN
jgi:hypothetical protein